MPSRLDGFHPVETPAGRQMIKPPITVRFPPHLRRFIELPQSVQVSGDSIPEVLDSLENQFPGVGAYLLHENGRLRQHVNIFLGERMVLDRENLSDSLEGVEQLVIMQALSGG